MGKVFRLVCILRLSDPMVMMSLYFFTGIFFTLSLNAFFTQLANDFVAGRGGLVQTSMGTTLM